MTEARHIVHSNISNFNTFTKTLMRGCVARYTTSTRLWLVDVEIHLLDHKPLISPLTPFNFLPSTELLQ